MFSSCNGRQIKIACIGDSLTYGAFLDNPEANGYPGILNSLFGSRFTVKNFGVKGAGILHDVDKPFILQQEFMESIKFGPDLILIMLGTNDALLSNKFKLTNQFYEDYNYLIGKYKRHLKKAKIVIIEPPKVNQNKWNIDNGLIEDFINPNIEEICKKNDIMCIQPPILKENIHYLSDGVHLNNKGTTSFVKHIHSKIKNIANLKFEKTEKIRR